jgi:polysaccharide biosynthesis transport protein
VQPRSRDTSLQSEIRGGAPPPQVEILSRSPGPATVRQPLRQAARFRVFALVFLLVLAGGSAWNFTRPALYRATATVLIEVPEGIGYSAGADGADPQNLAVQGRILLAQDLLQETLERAARTAPETGALDPEALRARLDVQPTPGTNLVALSATGSDPQQLAVLVNAWTQAYLERRQAQIERDVDGTLARLQDEYARLDAQKRAQAATLDRYRLEHGIDTMERDGNQALARLKTLTKDLETARAEQLKAESERAALEEAIDRGEPVVPPAEQAALEQLETEAAKLRAQLAGLAQRYTKLFLESEPTLKELPLQLRQLEARIKEQQVKGRDFLRSTLTREVERARRQSRVLEQELAVQRAAASRFTARFARYETLKKDLEQIDELHRGLEQRLVEVKTKAPAHYAQVKVLEPAFIPSRPFQPDYWRDFSYTLAVAGLTALLAVLLMEFLTRRERTADEQLPVTGVRVFAGDSRLPVDGGAAAAGAWLAQDQNQEAVPADDALPSLLPGMGRRELLAGEVRALLALADAATRQLMSLVLSGLTPAECVMLEARAIDLAAGTVQAPGDGRVIRLSPALAALFAGHRPVPLWIDDPAGGGAAGLLARIELLAHDAGLAHPAEVDAAAVRHTYICYLVRQGARLTEIERIIGRLPAAELARYAVYSPAGAAKPLAQVALVYPACSAPV